MPLASLVRRSIIVAGAVYALLFAAECLKGHGAHNAIRFAALWTVLTTAIYVASSLTYRWRGKRCAICAPEDAASK